MNQTIASRDVEPSMTYRQSPWGSVLLIVLAIFICFMFSTMKPSPGVSKISSTFGTFAFLIMWVLLPTSLAVLSHVYKFIRVTDETLQWRSLLSSRTVSWSEVTDYYELTPSYGGVAAVTCYIVTTQGNCTFLTTDFSHTDRLRRRVVQYAVNARAKEWDILGEPNYFGKYEYASPLKKWIVPMNIIIVVLFLGLIAQMFGLNLLLTKEDFARNPGWGHVGFTMFLILIFLIGDVIASFRRPRKNYSITVSKDGLLYKDSDREITSLWNEITAIQQPVGKNPIRIETKQGSFDFSTENPGYLTIRAALRRWADRLVVEAWKATQED